MITLARILRFSIFAFLLHGASASARHNDPFYQEQLGMCFANMSHFIRNVLGEQAINDQNIISTTKGRWHWITDQTATDNYAWYLLEDRKSLLCWRIFVPTANDLKLTKNNRIILARASINQKPDLPPKTIYLQEQEGTLAFKAYKCTTSKRSGHKNEIIQLPCLNIYD